METKSNLLPLTSPCGCLIGIDSRGYPSIAYCPLHRAAPDQNSALLLGIDIMERVAGELEKMGHEKLRSLLRSAIIEQKAVIAKAEVK